MLRFLSSLFRQEIKPPKRNHRRAIQSIDFTNVKKKLLLEKGWTNEQAEQIEGEYREFLNLIASHPNETIVPWSEELDIFWHQHILDSRQYMADCDAVFGRYIHHNPNLMKGTDPHRLASRRTSQLRRSSGTSRTQSPYDDGGPMVIPPTCGTDTPSSHKHSGSDPSCGAPSHDSGSSCGSSGSSCGSGCGSSCGGGGCGSGCGGS